MTLTALGSVQLLSKTDHRNSVSLTDQDNCEQNDIFSRFKQIGYIFNKIKDGLFLSFDQSSVDLVEVNNYHLSIQSALIGLANKISKIATQLKLLDQFSQNIKSSDMILQNENSSPFQNTKYLELDDLSKCCKAADNFELYVLRPFMSNLSNVSDAELINFTYRAFPYQYWQELSGKIKSLAEYKFCILGLYIYGFNLEMTEDRLFLLADRFKQLCKDFEEENDKLENLKLLQKEGKLQEGASRDILQNNPGSDELKILIAQIDQLIQFREDRSLALQSKVLDFTPTNQASLVIKEFVEHIFKNFNDFLAANEVDKEELITEFYEEFSIEYLNKLKNQIVRFMEFINSFEEKI